MIQWPESGTTPSVTLLAANRITVAIIGPNDFSPPINLPKRRWNGTIGQLVRGYTVQHARIMEIQSSVVLHDALHFCTLATGETDEAWGVAGVESILVKYLDLDADVAKHFFRKMDEVMQGECETLVDVLDDGDVVNISIMRKGMQTLHYPNRFVVFQSGGWSTEPSERQN